LPRDAEDFEVVVGDALVGWSVEAVSHRQPKTRTVMLQHVACDLTAKVERVTAVSSKPLDQQRQRCVMPTDNGSLVRQPTPRLI
jgi:hypothetical protein